MIRKIKYLKSVTYTPAGIAVTSIENELNINGENQSDSLVSEIENIKIDDNASWNEYVDLIEDYGFKNNLNLKEDPFRYLMTKSQQVELQKRINDSNSRWRVSD